MIWHFLNFLPTAYFYGSLTFTWHTAPNSKAGKGQEVPCPAIKVNAFCGPQFPGSICTASIESLRREKASTLTHKRELKCWWPLSPALSRENQEYQLTRKKDMARVEMHREFAHIPPQVTRLDLGKEHMWPAALKNTNVNLCRETRWLQAEDKNSSSYSTDQTRSRAES